MKSHFSSFWILLGALFSIIGIFLGIFLVAIGGFCAGGYPEAGHAWQALGQKFIIAGIVIGAVAFYFCSLYLWNRCKQFLDKKADPHLQQTARQTASPPHETNPVDTASLLPIKIQVPNPSGENPSPHAKK